MIVEGVEVPGAICACGARLHAVSNFDGTDWLWVDENEQMLVDRSPEGYREDPKGWWERLLATDVAAYSDTVARAALGMLGWTHMHGPKKSDPFTGEVPRCHGMPMRLTPNGWRCRETKHDG